MQRRAAFFGGALIFSTLMPSLGAALQAEDNATVAKELNALQQRVAELSSQVEKLERHIRKEPPANTAGLHLQVYKVADLVAVWEADFAKAYDFRPLIHYITTRIAPDQWTSAGGPGSISSDAENRLLVVSQSPEVHEKIQKWLNRLREAKKVLKDFEQAERAESEQPQKGE